MVKGTGLTGKPIIFSAPMVRALLKGRKTQTRRVFVPPAPFDQGDDITVELATGSIAPKWAVGDRLWVRENWRTSVCADGTRASILETPGNGYCWPVWYEADGGAVTWRGSEGGGSGFVNAGKLRPSIFMSRWASRLTLVVTEVRVERLQDISEADAVAEGISPYNSSGCYLTPHYRDGKMRPGHSAYDLYRGLWNDIHGDCAWDANPWVAAISFEVHRANIDAFDTGRAALAERGGAE